MENFTGWDIAILAIAAYIAIVTLVRLMRMRREEVVARLQAQVVAEQERKRAEARGAKRKKHESIL